MRVNRWVYAFEGLHWFLQLLAFLLVVGLTISMLIGTTVGWVLVGLEVGLAVGVIIVVKLSERLHLILLGIMASLLLNAVFAGTDPDASVAADGLGAFLKAALLALHQAVASTGLTAPAVSSLGAGLWAFVITLTAAILFGSLREYRHAPKGSFATVDFTRVREELVEALQGDWDYRVVDQEGTLLHSGNCTFKRNGRIMQLGGVRLRTCEGGESVGCQYPWSARHVIYTNLSEGEFLRFEYHIRTMEGNIEAYSSLDLREAEKGRITGSYDHLGGGSATGAINFTKT